MAKAFTGKIHVSIGADTSEVEKALKDLSKSVSKVSKGLVSFGKNVSVSLTAPLTAWGAAATAAAIKVRDALNDVAVGTGATGEALRGLQADFRAIAGQVPDDMSQTAKAIADVNTALGATGPELQQLSKSFLDLSRITKSDLSTNMSTVLKVMNNWGIAASQGTKVLDEFLFASQQTGISIGELAGMLAPSGNMFRTYGFTLEDSIALLSLMSKAGVDVTKVITGLDRSLGNLAKAGVKDLSSSFRAYLELIKNAKSETEALQLTAELFGKISDVPIMSAIRSGGFDIGAFSEQISNATGTLQTSIEETEGFSAKWGRLTNRMALALEPLGTHILKIAEEYLPALSDATGALNIDFSDTTIKIGMIVAVIGPATLALGAFTAAISSLIVALKTLIVFFSGPVGMVVGLGLLAGAFFMATGRMKDNQEEAKKVAEAYKGLNDQIRSMTMEQLKASLVSSESQLKNLRAEIYRTQAALAELNAQAIKMSDRMAVDINYDASDELLSVGQQIQSQEQRLARNRAREKEQEAYIARIKKQIDELNRQKPVVVGNAPNLSNSKTSASKSNIGKTEAEKFVENVQDRIKYLNEDGQKFLPTLEAMQAKLKPLSEDWKKLEDLRLNINKDAFDKSLQDVQDQIRYLNKDGAEFLPKLRDMVQGLDPLSENGKKVADVIKMIEDSLYSSTWSNFSWQFSEGFLKSSEYAEILRTEIAGLEEGTDKWRARFSELQNIEMSEVSRQLTNLSEDFHDGFLQSSEYEAALNAIIQDFADFPRIVQTATDALEAFRRQSMLAEISVGKQLSEALKEATIDFKELEGNGILRTIEGFLQASIYGEDFGESLKRLGQDIVYTTLKMLILSQLTQMLGAVFGGFLGLGSSSVEIPQINSNDLAWSNALNGIPYAPKYAKGGLVNKPTVFPMADGMGLMGEAGTEAIMPLGRDSQGRLGVYGISSGNTAPTVIVNVENQSGMQLTAQESGVSFDERFNRAVVSVILRDQATNGPISRNYRSVMR